MQEASSLKGLLLLALEGKGTRVHQRVGLICDLAINTVCRTAQVASGLSYMGRYLKCHSLKLALLGGY